MLVHRLGSQHGKNIYYCTGISCTDLYFYHSLYNLAHVIMHVPFIFFHSHQICVIIPLERSTTNPPHNEIAILPTQIAATPVIKGEEAKKIYREANRKHSPKAEVGAKKLADMFEKKMQ